MPRAKSSIARTDTAYLDRTTFSSERAPTDDKSRTTALRCNLDAIPCPLESKNDEPTLNPADETGSFEGPRIDLVGANDPRRRTASRFLVQRQHERRLCERDLAEMVPAIVIAPGPVAFGQSSWRKDGHHVGEDADANVEE